MTIVLLSSDPSAQSHAQMQNSKHCQAVIEEVNDRDLEKLVEENDFVAVAWFVILPKWKHSIRYIQNDFFEIVKVKSMSGSPRPARLATRQLPGWRGSTTSQTSDKITSLSSSSPSLTISPTSESKLLQELLLLLLVRYNIEFVKINNKKYARGWGIRSLSWFCLWYFCDKILSDTFLLFPSSRLVPWWSVCPPEKM